MLEENKRIQNTKVLVKFHYNADKPHSKNKIITKTLGKIGVISSDYNDVLPNGEEFWLCRIAREVTKTIPVSGLFILDPIHKVERDSINYVVHGLYTIEDEDGIRYVIPKRPELYWIMSIDDRRAILSPDIHAIVVVNYECGESMPSSYQDTPLIPATMHGDLTNAQIDAELAHIQA